ncbi:hypothetical protein DRO29_05960, partial [Candidatus Bathyarchaeota archaeon]
RWPIINFSLNEIASDPVTLTKTLRITNYGDTITDLEVFASDEIKDRIVFQPAIDHFRLESGRSVEFNVTPVLEEGCEGINGTIFARGGNKTIGLIVNFSCEAGKRIFIGHVGGEYYHYIHVNPFGIYVLPEQISSDTVVLLMYAVFNKSKSVFMINNVTRDENKFVIIADCLEAEESEVNTSVEMRYIVLTNLSVGDYILEIKESELNTTIVNKSFDVKPFGIIINDSESGLTAKLETSIGGFSNGSFYLTYSPNVPVCPPGLFEYTNFWTNSTSHLYLIITLLNEGSTKTNVTLTLTPEVENVTISPNFGRIAVINDSSSERILYELNLTGVPPGVYNITYNLTYTKSSANHTISGIIPFGVYELKVGLIGDNITMHLVTPFNDTVDALASNWANISLENAEFPIPFMVEYNITYSNFTIQEPHSPWMHIAIGVAVGGIIGSVAEAAHQYAEHGLDISKWNLEKIAFEGVKGAISGGVGAATFGTGSVLLYVGASAATDALLEAADQAYWSYRETGKLEVRDLGRVLDAGITSALMSVFTAGIKIKADYKRVETNLAKGMYRSGPWKPIWERWDPNNIMKQFSAVFYHVSLVTKQESARWVMYKFEEELMSKTAESLGVEHGKLFRVLFGLIYAEYYASQYIEDEDGSHILRGATYGGVFGSLPSQIDSDGDGVVDLEEIEYGTDPLNPYSHPGLSLNYNIHYGSCINGAPLKSKFKVSPYLKEYRSPVRNVEGVYILPYFPRTPPSSYRPFNTIIYLNDQEIGRIENTVPYGYYIFNADPSILNYASTGVGENVITLDVENMNRGYYVPLEGYKVYILFKEISIPVCAENQSEANRIASQLVGAMRRKPDFAVFSWDI